MRDAMRWMAALACGMAVATASLPAGAASAPDPDVSQAALLHDPQTPVGGNPAGDLTVVAFFDYNCPSCMATQPALKALLAADHGIRLVYKDWPIFGAGSVGAAKVALAAQYQGRYEAVHDALLAVPLRKVTAEQIRTIAVKAGADGARLDADLKAHAREIDAILARTWKQADRLKAPGTPVFLIGPLLVERPLDLPALKTLVAEARAKAAAAAPAPPAPTPAPVPAATR